MKILLIITKSNFGGAQHYVRDLAVGMTARGHRVAVACGPGGTLIDALKEHGIQTYIISSFQRDLHIGKELRGILELKEVYADFKPDLIHLNSSKAGGLGAFTARLCGFHNIVFTAHGWPFLEQRNVLWRTLAWLGSYVTALLCKKVIVVSQNDLDHSHMPLISSRTTLIHTAIDTIPFLAKQPARDTLHSSEKQREHQNDVWLGSIAELTNNKNIQTAIDAVLAHNTSAQKKIFYTVIGDGELHSLLTEYVANKPGADHIVLAGYVHHAATLLPAFDLFLLPSQKEGFPYALLEAGQAGLPCIASNVGGIPEIIEEGKTGLLIDPSETESVVRALHRLTDSPTLQREVGNALRRKVENEFALSEMIDKTEALYAAALT